MNANKICLIHQPAGLGDIFFCLYIAKHYKNLGYTVIWPVSTQILYIKNYIQNDGIYFVDIQSDFPKKEYYNAFGDKIETENFVYLPLSKSSYKVSNPSVMYSKYILAQLDFKMWKQNFEYLRNVERENYLYYKILNLKDDEQYVFLNKKYGTPPETFDAPISLDTDLKIVELQYIDGYNIFDWLKVIERASIVVTVDTSFQYLLEKINTLKATEFYCYPRNGKLDYVDTIK